MLRFDCLNDYLFFSRAVRIKTENQKRSCRDLPRQGQLTPMIFGFTDGQMAPTEQGAGGIPHICTHLTLTSKALMLCRN